MKEYTETKKRRYEMILSAFDKDATARVREMISSSTDFESILWFVRELGEARELITDEIKYLDEALLRLEEEQKNKEEAE